MEQRGQLLISLAENDDITYGSHHIEKYKYIWSSTDDTSMLNFKMTCPNSLRINSWDEFIT